MDVEVDAVGGKQDEVWRSRKDIRVEEERIGDEARKITLGSTSWSILNRCM